MLKTLLIALTLIYNINYAAADSIPQSTKQLVTANISCTDEACKTVLDTTTQVMDTVNHDMGYDKILIILTKKFDFQLMTKFAMGNNWKLATKQQQVILVKLFKQLLINTYSSAWSKFKGAQIIITKSQINAVQDNKSNKQTAIIISQVILPNSTDSQPIKVEYDLVNTGTNNSWMAYDIKIADASLITTYRNQFNDIIQNNKINGLITQLQAKVNKLKK